jgi:hypothetical protein
MLAQGLGEDFLLSVSGYTTRQSFIVFRLFNDAEKSAK